MTVSLQNEGAPSVLVWLPGPIAAVWCVGPKLHCIVYVQRLSIAHVSCCGVYGVPNQPCGLRTVPGMGKLPQSDLILIINKSLR